MEEPMEDGIVKKDTSSSVKKAMALPNHTLKRERERRGWTQAEVAKHLQAQTNLVTRWETGTAFPSPYYRQKLSQLFDMTVEELGLIKRVPEEAIQLDTGEMEPASQEEEHPVLLAEEDEKTASNPDIRHISRRALCIGALTGTAAGVIGWSLWMWNTTHAQASISQTYHYRQVSNKDVNYVSWSPHGNVIACADGDNTVAILEAASGNLAKRYPGDGTYENCLSWSPDQTRIATCGANRQVHIWDPLTAEVFVRYTKHTATVTTVAWSPNGLSIVSGCGDGQIHVWNPWTGEQGVALPRKHTTYVQAVSWSPDSTKVASCGGDGTIQIWYALTGQPVPTFRYRGPEHATVYQVIWSPDGTKLVSAHANGQVCIWDAVTGAHILTYAGHTKAVTTARWSPQTGKVIASAGEDAQIHIWDAVTGRPLLFYTGHTASIFEVSWSPDENHLASASHDHFMHVCRVIL